MGLRLGWRDHGLSCCRLLWVVLPALVVHSEAQSCELPTVTVGQGFETFVTEINAVIGTRVTIRCNAEPNSGVTGYFWQKNGESIPSESFDTLIRSPLQSSDGGVYRCGVEIMCGTALSHNVTINTPPMITELTGNSVVTEGESFQLSCAAEGWPEPAIQWYLDGVLVVGNGGVYSRSSALLSDSGEYSCEAGNIRGEDIHTLNLTVEELPTSLLPTLVPIRPSSIQLSSVFVPETSSKVPIPTLPSSTSNSIVPTPTPTHITTPEDDSRSIGESVIIGASVGGVAFGVLAIVVLIISILVLSRGRKKQPPQSDGAIYDEVGPPQLPPRKPAEVAMELNIAYASNIQVEHNAAYSGTVSGSTH